MRKDIGYHYINYFMGTRIENDKGIEIKNTEPHKHDDWEWVTSEKL